MKTSKTPLAIAGALALSSVPAAAQDADRCVDVEYVFPPPANQGAITDAIDSAFRTVGGADCGRSALMVSEARGGAISILATDVGIEVISDPTESLAQFAERAAREILGIPDEAPLDTRVDAIGNESPETDDACVYVSSEIPGLEQGIVLGALAEELEQRDFDIRFDGECRSTRMLRVSGDPGSLRVEAVYRGESLWAEQAPQEDSFAFAQRAAVELFGVVRTSAPASVPGRRNREPRHVDESGFVWFPFIGFNFTFPGGSYGYYDDYSYGFGYGSDYIDGVVTRTDGGGVAGLSLGVTLRHARPDQIDFQADFGFDGRNSASYSYLFAAARYNSVFLSNTLSARFPILRRKPRDRHFFLGWRSSVYLFGMYGVQVLGIPGATQFYTDNTFNVLVAGPSLGFQIERRSPRRNPERRRELDIRFNFDVVDTLSNHNINYQQIELRWRFGR